MYPEEDYGQANYSARLASVCCLEYGVPYLPANGFALMSVAHGKRANLLHAILSIQVLNTATPVLLGIVGFGWALYLVERRVNSRQFRSQAAAVCACMLPRNGACAAHGD